MRSRLYRCRVSRRGRRRRLRNIDSWAMSPGHMAEMLRSAAGPEAMLVIESAMGLFDGVAGQAGRSGAAADIAIRFAIPVILVIDVAGQAQSAARSPGASPLSIPVWKSAARSSTGSPASAICAWRPRGSPPPAFRFWAGYPGARNSPWRTAISGWSRARERHDLAQRVDALAGQIAETVDLDRVDALARQPAKTDDRADRSEAFGTRPLDPPGQRIALAEDDAFSFFYPHMAAGWRRRGAEIVRFSPLNDERRLGTATAAGSPEAIRASRRADRRRRPVPRRGGQIRRTPPGTRRMRRLHGAGQDAGGRGRRSP